MMLIQRQNSGLSLGHELSRKRAKHQKSVITVISSSYMVYIFRDPHVLAYIMVYLAYQWHFLLRIDGSTTCQTTFPFAS